MILFHLALLKTSMSIGKAITKFCCLQCHETLLEVPMWKETTRTHSSDDQTLCIVISQDKLWFKGIMVWNLLEKDWNMYKHGSSKSQCCTPDDVSLVIQVKHITSAQPQKWVAWFKRLAIKFSIHIIMGHFLNFTV